VFSSSVRVSVRASVRDVVSAISLVHIDGFSPNFRQSASWDRDELIRFWGQKVKGQGRRAEAYRARRLF